MARETHDVLACQRSCSGPTALSTRPATPNHIHVTKYMVDIGVHLRWAKNRFYDIAVTCYESALPLPEFTEEPPNLESDENKSLRKYAAIMRLGPILFHLCLLQCIGLSVCEANIPLTWWRPHRSWNPSPTTSTFTSLSLM